MVNGYLIIDYCDTNFVSILRHEKGAVNELAGSMNELLVTI
jgi:hypothetical protein